jgi:putative MATE family efflux protein
MRKNVDLLNGPIDSTLRQFALPLAISFIATMIYSWIDLLYISWLGPTSVAAQGISERIWFFIFGIGSGFAVGSSILVARRTGEGKVKAASSIAVQSTVIMFFISIILAVILHFSLDSILSLLGIKGEVRELSKIYFQALIWGVPFNFLTFHVNAVIRAVGNSFYPMLVLIGSNIVNAIIAPMLIFGIGPFPKWGIYGAGIGTAFAQFAGSIFAVILLHRNFGSFDSILHVLKINFKEMYRIVRLGLPASLQLIAVSITSMGLAANANLFGTEILSTFIIGLRMDLLVNMSIFALGTAVEIISGQNIGAKKTERIFKYHKSAIKQASIVLSIMGIAVFFFGKYIGVLFSSTPHIIRELDIYFKFAAFGYIPFAIGIISIRVISGAGDYFRSLKIVLLTLIITQLPFAFILSKLINSHIGIWISMIMAGFLFAIYSLFEVKNRKWLHTNV